MTITRRRILQGGALIGLSAVLPQPLRAAGLADGDGFPKAFERIRSALLGYFGAEGYRQIAAAPLATGDPSFNDGLRYDETGVLTAADEMVVQPCSRVADRAEAGRRDLLETFHIFAAVGLPGVGTEAAFAQLMGCLTGPLGLDPARLSAVSVPAFDRLRPAVENAGLDWRRQVLIRAGEEARGAGDGSGHFRHPDPRRSVELPTAGLYYRLADSAAAPTRHPLPAGWTEIGEFVLTGDPSTTSFGLGVERLALASTGRWPA